MMLLRLKSIFIFVVFVILQFVGIANDELPDSTFIKAEMKINEAAKQIAAIRFNEALADSLSIDLHDYFYSILQTNNAFQHSFDSLSAIGKVQSEDGNVRIFTWNLVRNNGTYTYFGLLQYSNKATNKVNTFKLIDKSDSIVSPENARLTPEQWYGALYYEIVQTKLDNQMLYTLLGWDGNTIYTNKKLIESLTFTASGKPKFGSSVFKFDRKKQKRVFFEYSRMANMMLSYSAEMGKIVFDHLSPSEPIYEGNVAYYGPDFTFDGFAFENDVWNYIPQIDYKSTPISNSRKKSKRNR